MPFNAEGEIEYTSTRNDKNIKKNNDNDEKPVATIGAGISKKYLSDHLLTSIFILNNFVFLHEIFHVNEIFLLSSSLKYYYYDHYHYHHHFYKESTYHESIKTIFYIL